MRDVADRMEFEGLPLIVTDGFDFYEKVVCRVFGSAALYGQVLKRRKNDRIVKVERRELMGAAWRFEEALKNSEDSSTLNTSFIERLESDHPAKLGVPGATNAFPRSLEGEARRATGTGPLLLQLRQAPRRSEVRTQDPDSGDAGRTRHPARDAQGDLCVCADIRININSVRRDRVRWHSQGGD